ncbi:hypothetical protein [Streptomyces sp. NPDC056010]|uniref:hypothetical protein n=1 Tax=Streptomyces sp. NPDC056010 TaxID=3345679 RepID=UPI0035DADFAB
MRGKSILFTAATTAFLSATSMSSAWAAHGAVLAAETTGAYGDAYVTFASHTYASKIEFRSVDLLADGHNARLRLMTMHDDGTVVYWGWRKNYGGKGAQPTWVTTLNDPKGIAKVRLQVCRAEANEILNCAYSKWEANYYA